MNNSRQRKVKSALLLALTLGLTSLPLLNSTPVSAYPRGNKQWNQPSSVKPANNRVVIPAGTVIPISYEKDKIVVTKDETAPLTLNVARDIRSNAGTILLRQGSQIVGELRPAGGGSQFFAQEIILQNGQRLAINGRSPVITRTETIEKGASTGSILQGAAIGAAAATAISAITGDRAIATEEVLGGAGLGALGGFLLGKRKVDVIVINPNTDLAVTLRSDLALK